MKPVKKQVVKTSNNPFQIVTDKQLVGGKGRNPLVTPLMEQMLRLKPKHQMESVFISPVIASEKKLANSLFLAAKREIAEKHIDYAWSARYHTDHTGKYLGANIWRIN